MRKNLVIIVLIAPFLVIFLPYSQLGQNSSIENSGDENCLAYQIFSGVSLLGVAASGVVAVVKHVDLQKAKDDLKEIKRIVDDLKKRNKELEEENKNLNIKIQEMEEKIKTITKQVEELKKQVEIEKIGATIYEKIMNLYMNLYKKENKMNRNKDFTIVSKRISSTFFYETVDLKQSDNAIKKEHSKKLLLT